MACSLAHNVAAGKKGKKAKPKDYMPHFGPKAEAQTPDELLREQAIQWAEQHNKSLGDLKPTKGKKRG